MRPFDAPLALFLSAHLDDAAFSVGGTLAALRRRGWRVVLATAFTSGAAEPTGFALACQLDKGLPAGADYMELRRLEDADYAESADVTHLEWLGLPEAPHRGYESAAELFAGVHPEDGIAFGLALLLDGLVERFGPELVFAPQGVGGHVDHLQVIRAVRSRPDVAMMTAWYRDLPYAANRPDAAPDPSLPAGLRDAGVALTPADLNAKLRGSACYATQVGFQFGGVDGLRRTLGADAASEGRRSNSGDAAESFLASPEIAARLAGLS